jgi:alkylation response protein AidB-like acyl-CoA dehydrogenase
MSTKTTTPDIQKEDDFVIDTAGMSEGKEEALRVTEMAREKTIRLPSFGSDLFLGKFRPDLLYPFPEQSADDKAIGDKAVAELEAMLKEHLDPDEVDRTREIPQIVMDKLAEMGMFAMKVPKEYDGLGFSQTNYNRIMHLVGSYCGSVSVLLSAHQSIGVPQPLYLFGTEKQKKQYMPMFRKGAISAFALTEPDVGSDPAKMTTTAVLTEDGEHYIINGDKLWITNGPIADLMVVMAKTAPKMVNGKERQQISAFIIETKWEGFEVLHRCDFLGLKGIHNGLLRFKDMKVPKENLLWNEGRGLALALVTLNTGRLTVPAACAGMSAQCLRIARKWGNERTQWGQPVGYHEAGRKKVAFIASSTFAMEAVTWLTSSFADEEKTDVRIEAAFAKLFCSEMSWEVIDTILQFRGGRGYETAGSLKARGEEPIAIERMMRDSRINRIIEGTSDIMQLFLAREAIDPHLKMVSTLLKKNASFGEKAGALAKAIGFYATWYPRQWINGSTFASYPTLGPLAKHFCYAEKTSHKLARKLFHAMARHQQNLEIHQVNLSHLTDVGMELFAIATTCSYAKALHDKKPSDSSPLELADHFCTLARQRIDAHFAALSSKDIPLANNIAKRVLEGDLLWQEEGIVSDKG